MRQWILSAVVAGAAASLVLSTPATATEPSTLSEASLVLTAHAEADALTPPTEVTLTCGPAGGTHADAESACRALESVDGDFAALTSLGGLCPMIYQPVLVEVSGTWRGREVSHASRYPNRCVAFDESQGVFWF